jgi:hypothetical protein
MDGEPTARRRSRAELRELVMTAALDLLRTEGLGAVPMTLTYQRVFDHLEATTGVRVTRASVHERIWESQEAFRAEVLATGQVAASASSRSHGWRQRNDKQHPRRTRSTTRGSG